MITSAAQGLRQLRALGLRSEDLRTIQVNGGVCRLFKGAASVDGWYASQWCMEAHWMAGTHAAGWCSVAVASNLLGSIIKTPYRWWSHNGWPTVVSVPSGFVFVNARLLVLWRCCLRVLQPKRFKVRGCVEFRILTVTSSTVLTDLIAL